MAYTTLISVPDMQQHRHAGWVVVDCCVHRADLEQSLALYAQAHIPGAVYAHLEHHLSGTITPDITGRHPLPEAETLAQQLGTWGISNHTQVVAYDANDGSYAARLWWLLRWLGHEAVAVLDGGLAAWQAAGLPLASGMESNPAQTFVPHVQERLAVDAAYVQRVAHDPAYAVIDARSHIRYLGHQEPLDRVAGRIPGALSYPFADNLQASGAFRSQHELRERFAPIADRQIVAYCGSGVTAAHNLLALEHAGIHDAKLYVGSWSEWITDSDRPIARD